MASDDNAIPPELRAKLEGPWREALERHMNEVRRTFEISTGFYEKLAALDAGSIAIAATVGAAVVAKAGATTPAVLSLTHRLVYIIFALLASLILGVLHNFIVVGIAQFEAKYSELDLIRTLMREGGELAVAMNKEVERSVWEHLRLEEEKSQRAQMRNATWRRFLQRLPPIVGYISLIAFVGAYVLVAICALRLWL